MACRVFRAVLLGTIKDRQLNTAKLVSFYRSTTDTQFCGDAKDATITPRHESHDKPGHSSKLEVNVPVETATAAESNDGYALWERKITGDDVQQDASHRV